MKIKVDQVFERVYDKTRLRVVSVFHYWDFAWLSDDSHPSILPQCINIEHLLDKDRFRRVHKRELKAA